MKLNPRKRARNGRRCVLVLLSVLALATGCGGGSGGDDPTGGIIGGGGSGGASLLDAEFQPGLLVPAPLTAAMVPLNFAGNVVSLDVGVTGTNGIASASMDVTFDPTKVEFVGWSDGNIFPPCGGSMQCWVSVQSDRLVIALVPLNPVGNGFDVAGTRSLIRLTFRAIQSGNSILEFDRMALRDVNVDDIASVTWHGGTLSAN